MSFDDVFTWSGDFGLILKTRNSVTNRTLRRNFTSKYTATTHSTEIIPYKALNFKGLFMIHVTVFSVINQLINICFFRLTNSIFGSFFERGGGGIDALMHAFVGT